MKSFTWLNWFLLLGLLLVRLSVNDAFTSRRCVNSINLVDFDYDLLSRISPASPFRPLLPRSKKLLATRPQQTDDISETSSSEHKHLNRVGKASCLLGIWVNFFFLARAVAVGSLCIAPPAAIFVDIDALTLGNAAAVIAMLHLAAGTVLLSELFDLQWVTPTMVRVALGGSFFLAAFGSSCF